jgi:dihydroneopterin aldolase
VALVAAEDQGRLGALIAEGPPLILVAPPTPSPRAETPEAQARVDLLAADQGAWLLAARDPRLTVAATRTEIDWALRRGVPVVWAPAKLSLDEGWGGLAPEERAARLAGLWGPR